MNVVDALKMDSWWKCVLICGILLVASSLIYPYDFIDKKFILGLGIGLTAIGIGYWRAQKTVYYRIPEGIITYHTFKHTLISKTIIGAGVPITLYFLFKILFIII